MKRRIHDQEHIDPKQHPDVCLSQTGHIVVNSQINKLVVGGCCIYRGRMEEEVQPTELLLEAWSGVKQLQAAERHTGLITGAGLQVCSSPD